MIQYIKKITKKNLLSHLSKQNLKRFSSSKYLHVNPTYLDNVEASKLYLVYCDFFEKCNCHIVKKCFKIWAIKPIYTEKSTFNNFNFFFRKVTLIYCRSWMFMFELSLVVQLVIWKVIKEALQLFQCLLKNRKKVFLYLYLPNKNQLVLSSSVIS